MRIKIKYASKGAGILLPLHYNSTVQGLIYKTFSEEISNFLHNEGYRFEKRSFKLFTFSRILNRGMKLFGERLSSAKRTLNFPDTFTFGTRNKEHDEEALFFKGGIEFYFSSPKNKLIEDMANRAIMNPEASVFGQELFVSSVEVLKTPQFDGEVSIKMLSPVTVYSTILSQSGKPLTYYYSPYEDEFSKLISGNAKKKHFLLTGEESVGNLALTPLYFSEKRNRVIAYFKNTRIEAWTGVFKLKGDISLIKTVYETGIGGKNSAGFGMFSLYAKKNPENPHKSP